MMIIWEEFCDGGTMCNVDTGGSPDNEANSPTLNLYDQLDHHHGEDYHHEDDHHPYILKAKRSTDFAFQPKKYA